VDENVSSAPREVTARQAVNMTKGLTGMSSIAALRGDEVQVVDMGISTPYECVKILNRRIRCGTDNIVKGPAMTMEEAEKAVLTGVSLAGQASKEHVDIVGVGEMGIGNTTTSACVLSAITGAIEEIIVGRGCGINDAGFIRKKEIVREKGLETEYEDVIDVLANVGGFDICAMTGFFLGAAKNKMPVVVDGYISAVAALAAYKLESKVKDYMFGSHISSESGYGVAMKAMDMTTMLDLDMRLGEGSGCVLAFEIIKGALGVMDYMATYDEAKIDEDYLQLMADAKF
jgi:nicotinate-nucleotide--dimethylbenzimidazole phosphoribosyltransferase